MGTVMDYLRAIEATIKDSDPMDGKVPSIRVNRRFSIYKYSLLYLISENKIKFTDDESQFIEYMHKFTLPEHLKTANAYLKLNDKPLIIQEVQHGVR